MSVTAAARRFSASALLAARPRVPPPRATLARRVVGGARTPAWRGLSSAPTPPPPPPSDGGGGGGGSAGGERGGGGGSAGPTRRTPISWLSLGLTAASAAGLYAYYRATLESKLHSVKTTGTAALGGPFSLTEPSGARVTEEALKGRWSILYFGFTKCPDICPDELEKLTAVVHAIDASGRLSPPLLPLFVTIDPLRDTAERLGAYFKAGAHPYHPRMVALTGSPQDIEAVARAYRIYYSKPTPAEAQSGDYLLDHSIIMYLLDPNGQFVAFYGKNFSAQEVSAKALAEIGKWQAEHTPTPAQRALRAVDGALAQLGSLLLGGGGARAGER